MYDPEFNMEMEARLEELYASTETMRQLVGEDHPATKVCEAFDNVFDVLEQMRNDCDNCFDEEKRSKIAEQITKLADIVLGQLKKLEELIKDE